MPKIYSTYSFLFFYEYFLEGEKRRIINIFIKKISKVQ